MIALEEWAVLGRTVGIGLLISASYVAQSVLTAIAIAAVFDDRPLTEIVVPIGGAVALIVGRTVAIALQEGISAEASVRITAALRRRLLSTVNRLGPVWVAGRRSGDLEATLVDGVERLDQYFRRFVSQALVSGVTVIVTIGIVATVNPVVAMLVSLAVAAAIVAPQLEMKKLESRLASANTRYRNLSAEFMDALQGMAVLKAFNASRRVGGDLARRAVEVSEDSVAFSAIGGVVWGVIGLATAAGNALALAVAAFGLATGADTQAAVFLVLLLVGECFRPVHSLMLAYHFAMTGVAPAREMFAILDESPQIVDGPNSSGVADLDPTITFEGVTFGYTNEGRYALVDFDLHIGQGETVAVVGRSGAGKSTVVNLLLRLLDPQAGTVRIGGRDVRDLSVANVRAMIALVSQDTYLFGGTVRENLQMARPDADEGAIWNALAAARAETFVLDLPDGLDTMIGERGMRLSGGERQRLAIARALLKDAPILVLDEATSSVDVANEAAIQRAIEVLSANRTTLVIAHRLSTVVNADRIVVIDGGQVVEEGTHETLIGTSGAYRRLVAAQEAAR